MDPDIVSACASLPNYGGVLLRAPTDDEKGRLRRTRVELVENLRGPDGMRPVIERQRDRRDPWLALARNARADEALDERDDGPPASEVNGDVFEAHRDSAQCATRGRAVPQKS